MSMESLERLERKVRRLVAALEEARAESQRLRQRLGVGEPPAPKGAEVERQLRLLQEERTAIRDRVERAISRLEEAS